MGARQTEAGKKALEYVKKFRFTETNTLVRMLCQEHPELFPSSEKARTSIRYYRGSKGDQNAPSPYPMLTKEEQQVPAKILVFDIETAPLKQWAWSIWKAPFSFESVERDWFILTWSAKWLFSEEMMNDQITPEELKKEDDSRIVHSIWKLMDEADIVIAHNGIKFDIRKLNTRFLIHGFNNPSPYQVIDTLRHARKHLAFTSNRLDALGEILGVGRKIHTGFSLWLRCMEGDQEAINEMGDYNDQDVYLLEEVYLRLRPFIKPHPNMGLFIGDDVRVCATCGADETKLEWTGQDYVTYANRYASFRCSSCGSIGRSRDSSTPKSVKKNMIISTPK